MYEWSVVSLTSFSNVRCAGLVYFAGKVNFVLCLINRSVGGAINGVGRFIFFEYIFQCFGIEYIGFAFNREIDMGDAPFFGYLLQAVAQLSQCAKYYNVIH